MVILLGSFVQPPERLRLVGAQSSQPRPKAQARAALVISEAARSSRIRASACRSVPSQTSAIVRLSRSLAGEEGVAESSGIFAYLHTSRCVFVSRRGARNARLSVGCGMPVNRESSTWLSLFSAMKLSIFLSTTLTVMRKLLHIA